MRDEIATSYIVMKRIIKEYYKQLYASKFDNLTWDGKVPWHTTRAHSGRNRWPK